MKEVNGMAILNAISNGDFESVKQAVAADAKVLNFALVDGFAGGYYPTTTDFGSYGEVVTPLIAAAQAGNVEILRFLLGVGAKSGIADALKIASPGVVHDVLQGELAKAAAADAAPA